MKPQRTYSKGTRALVTNSNMMNIDQTIKPCGSKQAFERSPKRRESFKIKKTRKFDVNDAQTQSEKPSSFLLSPNASNSANVEIKTQNTGNPYLNKSYIPPDNSLAHYTLMSHSNSNNQLNNTSIYANPNISVLVGQDLVEQDVNNIFDDFEHFSFHTFPSYFNPRTATNMHHQEKVNKWLEKVPIFNVTGELWENECYSVDDNIDWEEQEFDYGLEHRQNLQTLSYATADELLHLQSKRLDTLVRRLYAATPELPLEFTK